MTTSTVFAIELKRDQINLLFGGPHRTFQCSLTSGHKERKRIESPGADWLKEKNKSGKIRLEGIIQPD